MCGLGGQKQAPPPPTPAPPPVLQQSAPKSASDANKDQKNKRAGLSRYKIDKTSASSAARNTQLGGIPTKTGAGA